MESPLLLAWPWVAHVVLSCSWAAHSICAGSSRNGRVVALTSPMELFLEKLLWKTAGCWGYSGGHGSADVGKQIGVLTTREGAGVTDSTTLVQDCSYRQKAI